MQAGRRYTLGQTLRWGSRYIFLFIAYATIPVVLYEVLEWDFLSLPWQPISRIGIAVAFYLGFKNNSSYERLWEARKIWGGIVNASRSFTVMARDFVTDERATGALTEAELRAITTRLVHRHLAWLHSLAIELRKPKEWEHNTPRDHGFREQFGTAFDQTRFETLERFLSAEEFRYAMSKDNRSLHLLSLQSKDLMALRQSGPLEHFRHLQMQKLVTELFDLQGKSERIKNFPFPRQYATVNFFFAVLFIVLLPFGMINVFASSPIPWLIWLSIPFSVVGSWVFWTMEMIGDYSENPFEGLYNDVPIASMAVGIERDLRQMLDDKDLPDAVGPIGEFKMLL